MKKETRNKRRRGSAFVETGLIFTTFAFLLVGTFDFGQFLFVHQALVERARSSARWGLVNDPTATDSIKNIVLYNQSTQPSGATGYFGLTSSMVTVTNPGTGTSDNRIVILISNYPYIILSPYIGGTYTGPNITVVQTVGN